MRQIKQKMIDYIDLKLKNNAVAQSSIEEKIPRTLFLQAAIACIGIMEQTGNNDGPLVELIQSTIGEAERESWCMSFIQTCLSYVEIKTGIKSPIFQSEHCLTVWNRTNTDMRVKKYPLPGAIAIWKHGDTTNGHTGIILTCENDGFEAIEGNTTYGKGENGQVIRNGGGIYLTQRSLEGSGIMKLVGFLKPF